jgi:hypothetical protein
MRPNPRCTPGCNRPIITEIVPPEVRGTILGVWIGIEGPRPSRSHSDPEPSLRVDLATRSITYDWIPLWRFRSLGRAQGL